MLRRIFLVVQEFLQEEAITSELQRIFKGVHTVNLSTAGDLLLNFEELVHGDLIITERYIPLLVCFRDAQKRMTEVQALFPRTCEWDDEDGGETLIACLREKEIMCPAIIYSPSCFREGVCDPHTVYCEKKDSFDNLILAIRSIASTMIQVRTHPCL